MEKKIIYNSQKIRNSNNNLRIVFLLAKWDLTQVQKGRTKIEKITWDIKKPQTKQTLMPFSRLSEART